MAPVNLKKDVRFQSVVRHVFVRTLITSYEVDSYLAW